MSELVQETGTSLGRSTGLLYQHYAHPSAISSLLQRVPEWVARHRQRRALAELDGHLLDDIGISQSAARREAAKPFWR